MKRVCDETPQPWLPPELHALILANVSLDDTDALLVLASVAKTLPPLFAAKVAAFHERFAIFAPPPEPAYAWRGVDETLADHLDECARRGAPRYILALFAYMRRAQHWIEAEHVSTARGVARLFFSTKDTRRLLAVIRLVMLESRLLDDDVVPCVKDRRFEEAIATSPLGWVYHIDEQRTITPLCELAGVLVNGRAPRPGDLFSHARVRVGDDEDCPIEYDAVLRWRCFHWPYSHERLAQALRLQEARPANRRAIATLLGATEAEREVAEYARRVAECRVRIAEAQEELARLRREHVAARSTK